MATRLKIMNRRRLCTALVLAVLSLATLAARATAQTNNNATTAPGGAPHATAERKLSAEEERLMRGSKAAIVGKGITEPYFDAHFKLVRVINTAGDRRVVWRYSVNGHEATINDSVGFYTDSTGKRVNVHSVAGTLAASHDITKTITRAEAERVMRSCIGQFAGGVVVFQTSGIPPRTALIFTATSVPKASGESRARREREEREHREREERERRERAARTRRSRNARQKQPPPADMVEEEDEGNEQPIYIGAVDLETGACTKGKALAGPDRDTGREAKP